MDKLRILGGRSLRGSVRVAGAKNSALPLLAASLLTPRPVALRNLPRLRDVETMVDLLGHLNVSARREGPAGIVLQNGEGGEITAPYELVKTMRASILVLGPLLARRGRARVSLPGGCAIGARPVDLHIEGLRKLGARIEVEHGYLVGSAPRLRGARFEFPTVTVTGTENLLMAAVLAEGETVLENCACEPEVQDLAEMLGRMGARIDGVGTPTLTVQGVEHLGGALHEIIPDRIEAGTYILAGAITRGRIRVEGCRPDHLEALIGCLRHAGVAVEEGPDWVAVSCPGGLRARGIETQPYPGFPTDMQAQWMALMTQADGHCEIVETIFENRFLHAVELKRMGAQIELAGHRARVHGRTPLSGCPVMATDLRASACLVLAGLVAEGETIVDRIYHLDRGYERLEEKLAGLGARVERIRGGVTAEIGAPGA